MKTEKAIAIATAEVQPGEQVLHTLNATLTSHGEASGTISGALVLTSQRIRFIGSLLFHREDTSYPLDTVTSIDLTTGLLKHVTLTAAGRSARFLAGPNAKAWVDAANGARHAGRAGSGDLLYSRVGTPSGPPPGWYNDPHTADLRRWWNGLVWTEHTNKPN